MDNEIVEITGEEYGPTSIIMAGVHGNEKCGVEALNKLIPLLEIKRGKVLFVFGNPLAVQKNVRFVDTDLNRMFKPSELISDKDKTSYEYERAQFLKKYLEQADVLLDIHASSNPESRRFLICEPNARDIAKYLPADLIVSGFDEVEPGGTDYYMNSLGKIGICAECGYLGDPASTKVAEEIIISFLAVSGHINRKLIEYQQSKVEMYSLYVTKTNNFTLAKKFSDFEKLSKGDVIGMDGNEKVAAPKDSVIIFASNCTETGDEAFLLGVEMTSSPH